jgi:hypothetical protein
MGLLGAGFFVTDPMNGYPPVHRFFTRSASVAFIAFSRRSSSWDSPGLFQLPRVFARWNNRTWAVYSVCSGAAFLAAFVSAVRVSRKPAAGRVCRAVSATLTDDRMDLADAACHHVLRRNVA